VTAAADELGPGRSRKRRIGGLIAGLLVVAFLGLAVIEGWRRVSSYDWALDWWLLAVAAVAVSGSLVCNGMGYILILERLAGRRLARRRQLAIWSRSLLARYVPGNVLMLTSRVVLGREAGVSGRVSLAASVYEQVFLLGLGAIASVGLLLHLQDLGQGPWIWAVAVVPLALVVLHPRVFAPLSTWALRRVGREPLESFLSLREVAGFVALYTLVYCLLGIGVWAIVRALAGPAGGDPLLVGAAFLLSFVVSMLAFVFPSGLGVREGVFALVLARTLPGGVAIAVAAATRLALTAVEIGFAAVVNGLEKRRQA
jgi:glycosyltransferase 2 family protein